MELVYTGEACRNLDEMLSREWVEPNGLGGYASSTLVDCHTRKYHGLLVCNLPEPAGKYVLLSKVDAALTVGGHEFELGVNQYPGVFHPQGHDLIEEVRCGLAPSITWRAGGCRLRRTVMMVRGQRTVLVRYELLEAPGPVVLKLRPLVAFRDFHGVQRKTDWFDRRLGKVANGFSMRPFAGLPALYMDMSQPATLTGEGDWYYNLEFRMERARGLDFREDVYCPGWFELTLSIGKPVWCRGAVEAPKVAAEKLWAAEWERREKQLGQWPGEAEPWQMVKARSEGFLVRNPRGEASIVAGYHWFAEWGRDAMIALPGLTLSCGRHELALDVLRTYAGHERNGLVPNYLAPAGDQHAYNSVDASLWFCRAVQVYWRTTGNEAGVKKWLLPTVERIVAAFAESRAPFVRCLENGLISVGNARTQLTWMDARVNGRPVTPRHGLAVELNALWYNALCLYADLTGSRDGRFGRLRDAARSAFASVFYLGDRGYLADVVRDGVPDQSMRPNQLLAVALPHSALSVEQGRSVVARVAESLVTPFGLRSLSPDHRDYVGRYGGNVEQRDSAYHQGTVWAWLVGPYVEAALRVAEEPAAAADMLARQFMPLFEDHLRERCVWSMSEIFDGEAPHTPRGAVSQAWSVGEAIRARELIERARGGQRPPE